MRLCYATVRCKRAFKRTSVITDNYKPTIKSTLVFCNFLFKNATNLDTDLRIQESIRKLIIDLKVFQS